MSSIESRVCGPKDVISLAVEVTPADRPDSTRRGSAIVEKRDRGKQRTVRVQTNTSILSLLIIRLLFLGILCRPTRRPRVLLIPPCRRNINSVDPRPHRRLTDLQSLESELLDGLLAFLLCGTGAGRRVGNLVEREGTRDAVCFFVDSASVA